MARLVFDVAVDMLAYSDRVGTVVRTSPDRFVADTDDLRLVYRGEFDVSDDAVFAGTIESLRATRDGERVFLASDLSADFAEHSRIWSEEGFTAAGLALLTGDDRITGSGRADTLVGLGGDDRISGRGGDDTIEGNDGDDRLQGGRGDDELFGHGGRDRLQGGSGSDFLMGLGGRDRLEGGSGEDDLFGGAGRDRLKGGSGADVLFGEGGNDVLIGGRGSDVFYFDTHQGRDVVRDFEERDFVAFAAGLSIADLDIRETDRGTVIELDGTEALLRGVEDLDVGAILFL